MTFRHNARVFGRQLAREMSEAEVRLVGGGDQHSGFTIADACACNQLTGDICGEPGPGDIGLGNPE